MATRLVFPEPRRVFLEEVDRPVAREGRVLVKTHYSLMSTGTENIAFNKLYDPGTHWELYVRYPFFPGYACAGIVEDVGEGVHGLALGDAVFVPRPHASHHVVRPNECVRVPADSLLDAPWYALARIAFVGFRNAGLSIGESVVVVGAGPIGQMTLRWAAAAGLERVIVVDTEASRLEHAARGGATAVVASPVASARREIVAANGGELPACVIDATGNAAVLAEVLRLTAYRGKVVLLGDTGSPTQQHLTPEVITRGITIVGTHAAHLPSVLGLPGASAFEPVGPARARVISDAASEASALVGRLFFGLVAAGRFPLDGLTTHTFPPAECAAAYEVVNTRRDETMGVVFDWTGGPP